MRRFKSKSIYVSIGLVIVVMIGWLVYSIFAMPVVKPQKGDGQFENTSWRFPYGDYGFPIPGYSIKFEEFNLRDEYAAAYKVRQLPEIGDTAILYFCVRKSNGDGTISKNSSIDMIVTDSKGQTICDIRQPLTSFIWSYPQGGENTCGLYLMDESFFFAGRSGEL